MKTFFVHCLAFLLTLAATPTAPGAAPSGESFKKGDKAYLKFSLYQEKNRHFTTNYRRGILLPINTEVEFVRSTSKLVELLILPSKERLTIENIKDYSGESIDGIIQRTLSKTKVDLGSFTETERRNILKGTIALGMSKDAVIKAIGYPPKHKTPSLESNEWRYWMHRLGTFIVSFTDNKVSKVEPPHDFEAPAQ